MGYPIQNGEIFPGSRDDRVRDMGDEIMEKITFLVEGESKTDPDLIELLFSIRDAMVEASNYRMFPKIDPQYFREVIFNMAAPSSQNFPFHISELAREFARNGILEEGESLAELGHQAFRMNKEPPTAPILIRLIDNYFWMGFYLAREKWFTEALDIYRLNKKKLKKSQYQDELWNKFLHWLSVSEVSGWNESEHKINFEIMMIKFARGEI